jgi:Fuc2NAc and GlcNAc transferase
MSLILGGIGAYFVSRYANKLGLVDIPNERSSHNKPIPKGGGLGILVAFVVSAYLLKIPLWFWIPVTLLACISLIGDRFELSPKIRLILQLLASIVFLSFLLSHDPSPMSFLRIFHSNFLLISWLICLVLFMVGTANFYNFMDGINGIAGITGVSAFGLLASYIHITGGNASLFNLVLCLAIACVGFLPFNMPNAKVFMGDVGSILLGFTFAGTVLFLSKNLMDFICLASFLLPFYIDELTTMYVRLRDHEHLFHPHRRHVYQILANEKGFAHWKVSVGYGVLQVLVGMTILLTRSYGWQVMLPVLAGFILSCVLISVGVRRISH